MRSLLLLPLLVVAAAASAAFDLQLHREEWAAFKLQHGKRYASAAEERARMAAFAQSRLEVARHNMRYALGLESFRLALNEFSDMSADEFTRAMNGAIAPDRTHSGRAPPQRSPAGPAPGPLPRTVDWRSKGAVTRVKNQGSCGSCYAFAAVGAVESQVFLKQGQLVALSEQNVVDCAKRNGCSGGVVESVYLYIQHHGIDTEAAYPYEATNKSCRFKPDNATRPVVDYKDLSSDERELQEDVANRGPVAVVIDASPRTFQYYSGGVYYDPSCSRTKFNHAVLVVGYGTDERGGDYWLVKNSWGRGWGQDGYIKMARNRNNHCGIASYASIPLVRPRQEELEWVSDA